MTTTRSERAAEVPITAPMQQPDRQPWELYALVGGLVVLTTVVIMGNVPRMAPWLLGLMVLGIGQALLLSPTTGTLGGLAVVVLWTLLRQRTGVWTPAELLQNLQEVIGLTLNLLLTIRYRRIWNQQQQELHELRQLRQVLVAGEAGTGLLALEVAELRLHEEIDRARLFRRPLALLLVESQPRSDNLDDDGNLEAAYQAVVRRLTTAAFMHDIPFRINENRLGLILLERTWDRLYEHAETIAARLKRATFIDAGQRTHAVQDYLVFTFGLGTYQGEEADVIDLMRAAEDSLGVSRELIGFGETHLSAFAMPATPITEPQSSTSGGGAEAQPVLAVRDAEK